MFAWDDKYRFIFSDLGASDKVGVNDVGIGVFKRKPYIGLTKEILQNSTDAPDHNLPAGTPVRVRFELVYIDRDDIPDVERLNSVIHKALENHGYTVILRQWERLYDLSSLIHTADISSSANFVIPDFPVIRTKIYRRE